MGQNCCSTGRVNDNVGILQLGRWILANDLVIRNQPFNKNTALRSTSKQSNIWKENNWLQYCSAAQFFLLCVCKQWRLFTDTYHECPLLDFACDDGASLGHPGQQHSDSADRQPADIQAARCRVQLVDFGASCPEGHQPAAGEHWNTKQTWPLCSFRAILRSGWQRNELLFELNSRDMHIYRLSL